MPTYHASNTRPGATERRIYIGRELVERARELQTRHGGGRAHRGFSARCRHSPIVCETQRGRELVRPLETRVLTP